MMKKTLRSIPRFASRSGGWFLSKLDSLMKKPIGAQLFVVLFLTVCIFGVCSWISGKEIYDLFLYATNPPADNEPAPDKFALATSDKFWISGVFIGFSIIFLGLFVTLFVNWIDRRRESYINGDSRYNVNSNFAVVLGGHSMVATLCRTLLSRPANHRVVVLSRRMAEPLRKEIFSVIDPEDHDRVLIYNGNRVAESDLEELNLECAGSIYIIGENSTIDGSDHDETNMVCYDKVCDILSRKTDDDRMIPVHVMFCYHSTFTSFQYTDILSPRCVRFIPFSFYETWAQQVVSPGAVSHYRPLEGDNSLTGDNSRRVHLIIVGMSRMGVAMAVQAAQVAHYPNFSATGRRTLITVIDSDMRREMDYFKSRYPVMFSLARQRFVDTGVAPSSPYKIDDIYTRDFTPSANGWFDPMSDRGSTSPFTTGNLGDQTIDIDWEFINGDVASPAVRRYLEDAAADPDSITNIAVCLPDTVAAISAALYMPDSVYPLVNQVLVYQETTDSIVSTLNKGGVRSGGDMITASRGRNKLVAFGMMDRCNYASPVYNLEAKLINYFYDGLFNHGFTEESFSKMKISGEMLEAVEVAWNKIGTDGGSKGKSAITIKWSNIFNANMIPAKLRAFGLDESVAEIPAAYIEPIARTEHLRWNVEQILAGFRPELSGDRERCGVVDGNITPLRNNMIHPSITSFDKLEVSEQKKDDMLTRLIPTILRLTREASEYYKTHPDNYV